MGGGVDRIPSSSAVTNPIHAPSKEYLDDGTDINPSEIKIWIQGVECKSLFSQFALFTKGMVDEGWWLVRKNFDPTFCEMPNRSSFFVYIQLIRKN